MERQKATYPALVGFSTLVIIGIILTLNEPIGGMPSDQILILSILLTALTPMLQPLAMAIGGEVLMPISGAPTSFGLYPLLSWILAGGMVGIMCHDKNNAVKASILMTSMYYLLWLGLTIAILPNIREPIYWSLYIGEVFGEIIFKNPIDLFAIYLIPIATSTGIDYLITSLTREKEKPTEVRKVKVWEF